MGALPKRKYAKSRQGKRRSHLKLSVPSLGYCNQCHSPKLSHHICSVCGSYNGREVMEIKSPTKRKRDLC